MPQVVGRELAPETALGQVLDHLRDMGSGVEDRSLQAPRLPVVPTDHRQFVVDGVMARQVRERPPQGREKTRNALACRHFFATGTRVYVDQAAIHFAEGAMGADGL